MNMYLFYYDTPEHIFHPLLPIYMIMEAFNVSINYHIEDTIEGIGFYLKYLLYLETLYNNVKTKLENEADETKYNIISNEYSFGLRSLLFSSDVLNMTDLSFDPEYTPKRDAQVPVDPLHPKQFISVSLLTNSLRNRISGIVDLDDGSALNTDNFIELMNVVNPYKLFVTIPDYHDDNTKLNAKKALKLYTQQLLIEIGNVIITAEEKAAAEKAAAEKAAAEKAAEKTTPEKTALVATPEEEVANKNLVATITPEVQVSNKNPETTDTQQPSEQQIPRNASRLDLSATVFSQPNGGTSNKSRKNGGKKSGSRKKRGKKTKRKSKTLNKKRTRKYYF